MSHRTQTRYWIVLALTIGFGLVILRSGPLAQRLSQWQYERTKPAIDQLPESASTTAAVVTPSLTETPPSAAPAAAEPAPIPPALNRSVSFTSQAPTGNWDEHHEEYCEEASALMVGRFFQSRPIANIADAEAGLLALEQWQIEHFGYFQSTTAAETAQMIADVYDIDATVVDDVSSDSIKQALADGALVVLPTAGRLLHNPYYKQPGPIYHMLVIKGFTADDQFITNDPGTKRGADYVYSSATLLAAVGDYNQNNPEAGAQVMIVVRPNE